MVMSFLGESVASPVVPPEGVPVENGAEFSKLSDVLNWSNVDPDGYDVAGL